MKPLVVLRDYLVRQFPQDIHQQDNCTCGAANHVRIQFFRVEGRPAVAVFPEGMAVDCERLSHALGSPQVEPLPEEELDAIYADTELGHMQPFESPFGFGVYLDASLLSQKELVFCPRMFFGQAVRECFCAPLLDFLNLTHARVVPLTFMAPAAADAWAV
ncbi:MAG TPA: YbaK/EbsC family protein [Candidatus Acidoferrales bacterium]|nr:YbaK/EbsC family protein [Candidatus Acidoferrales bacterium]